jgi:sec-independent protein translocase protein TatB
MFGIDSSELLVIIIVAVVFIGPKDLPRALYKVGQVVGKAKAMTRHFRTGLDAIIREAEMEELQKQWAKENERIMLAHPQSDIAAEMKPLADEVATAETAETADLNDPPASVELPLATHDSLKGQAGA